MKLRIYYPKLVRMFRVPHDVERMNVDADDLRYRNGTYGKPRTVRDSNGEPILKPFPEVFRLDPGHHTIIDCHLQRVIREMNPRLSLAKVSTLLGSGLALTNDTGFPGKRNCLTGADSDKPFPRFDQPRLFGGAVLPGVVFQYIVWLESINVSEVGTTKEVLDSGLWFYWTSVNPKGEVNYITRLGTDGKYHRIKFPFVTTESVYMNREDLHELKSGDRIPEATEVL